MEMNNTKESKPRRPLLIHLALLASVFTLAIFVFLAMGESAPRYSNLEGSGKECGGISNYNCGEGLYCKFPDGACGENNITGVCKPVSTFCELGAALDGLCGCDGNMYGNWCLAGQRGVSIRHFGPCKEQ